MSEGFSLRRENGLEPGRRDEELREKSQKREDLLSQAKERVTIENNAL